MVCTVEALGAGEVRTVWSAGSQPELGWFWYLPGRGMGCLAGYLLWPALETLPL